METQDARAINYDLSADLERISAVPVTPREIIEAITTSNQDSHDHENLLDVSAELYKRHKGDKVKVEAIMTRVYAFLRTLDGGFPGVLDSPGATHMEVPCALMAAAAIVPVIATRHGARFDQSALMTAMLRHSKSHGSA